MTSSALAQGTEPSPPELWAGFECTVRRVGDGYLDELVLTGHDRRPSDLDLLVDLGARAVRYPILWERTAPGDLRDADWRWADERLWRLRTLGIEPIVGLVHHGSGPRHTSLVDDTFVEGLARYAASVASRYPWVRRYTPVNEPLTTARFSGLYGHWYPHGRDEAAFVRALLVQCRAVAAAMAAIREVVPGAELVQTEDVGKVFSTPALAYQAEFENERRWLSYDLLSGRVHRDHPLWGYLLWAGASEADLMPFLEAPCPPDLVGVNHYLSGERFLDERLERYPPASHGGNGRHRYADVLAARVCGAGPAGSEAILREVWERYRLPMAVTEVHNGSTREEQLRWLRDVWEAACVLRREGADIQAVTLWSLLGAYDWNSLLTRSDGVYEPGVYDISAPRPRPTALAGMARALARGREYDHPVLAVPGWWRRRERLWHERVDLATGGLGDAWRHPGARRLRPIVIVGGGGQLARAVARACSARGLPHRVVPRTELDITDPDRVWRLLGASRPWAVINAARAGDVDTAELEPHVCYRVDGEGPGILAAACAAHDARLVTFSSSQVFDGALGMPYAEHHAAAPLNVYGRAKAEAERRVHAHHEGALIVRAGTFFGAGDALGVVRGTLRALERGEEVLAPDDVVVSPTYVPHLVEATLDLLIDGESGVWHLANAGDLSPCAFVAMLAERVGFDTRSLVPCSVIDLDLPAPRPPYSALTSARATLLPPLDRAVAAHPSTRLG
jgi:dTDP-4-dehydrorhamnose reductase